MNFKIGYKCYHSHSSR